MNRPGSSAWRLMVYATPINLLIELLLHRLLRRGQRVPAGLQRRVGKAWAARS